MEGTVAVLPGKFLKSLRNHTSHQVGGLFGGTLVVRFDTMGPLGSVQDARDVMVMFGVMVVFVRRLDELTAGRRPYVMTAWW